MATILSRQIETPTGIKRIRLGSAKEKEYLGKGYSPLTIGPTSPLNREINPVYGRKAMKQLAEENGQSIYSFGDDTYDISGKRLGINVDPRFMQSENITPTVVSSTSITDKKIPELKSKIKTLPGAGGATQIANPNQDPSNGEGETDFGEYSILGESSNTTSTDPLLDAQFKFLDDQTKYLDANAQQDIERVKSSIQGLMTEQRVINEAANRGTKGAILSAGGSPGGGFRYAPYGSYQAVANEATAGVRALSDLVTKENDLIAGIRADAQENNFRMMEKKFGLLDQVRKERAAKTAEINASVEKTRRKAIVENAVIGEINKGNTNPMSIFQALGGDIGFDEITAITKELPKQDSFTLGSQDIRYDAAGNIIARGSKVGGGVGDVMVGDSLSVGNPIVTIGEPTVPGLGKTYGSSTVQAQLIIDDIVNGLPTQLINNVAEIPRWQESVRKQLAAGYQPQQIIDKLSGFRVFDETKKPLGDVFYNLAIGTDLEPQVISDLINRGANEQAMTTVENAQLGNASGFFSATDKARSTIKQADTVLAILNDPTFPADKLGPFDGRTFKVGRFSGMTNADTVKVQQLESALQLLNAPIRLEVAGTAATPEEMAKITAFQADILSQPEIVKTQVESLRDSVLGFHNEARSQRGLPTVDKQQVIDNKKRLELYKGLGKQNSAIQYGELSNEDLLKSINGVPYQPVGSQSNSEFWSKLTQQP